MYPQLTVIGTGSAKSDAITLNALNRIKNAKSVVLRTERMPVKRLLESENIEFSSLDNCYDTAENFNELNVLIAAALKAMPAPVCYLVYGSALDDTSVEYLIETQKNVDILPGVSCACAAAAAFGITGGYFEITATKAIEKEYLESQNSNIITCIDSYLLASELKCKLLLTYCDDCPAYVYSENDDGSVNTAEIRLFELDRLKRFDHTVCLCIRAQTLDCAQRYNYNHLLEIIARLCAPDGCPWDKEQTHQTLRPFLIEEAYEVADTIDKNDIEHLYDELGDVLLQVVFHAQIAKNHGEFDSLDITNAVCEKMIRRHPHIFANTSASTSDEVLDVWEEIKKKEKQIKTSSESMRDIPTSFPALMRAQKIQHKASKSGYNWKEYAEAINELTNKIDELKTAVANNQGVDDAAGELLFSAVNLCRQINIPPELALFKTTEKFIERFELNEQNATNTDKKV